jgi:endonuclease/exonuclease/phosphatase family metal-dependent hydrolase
VRVAFLNLQSGVGMSRGYWQYLTTSWKYLLPHVPSFVEPLGAFIRAQGIDLLGCVETELPSRRGRGVDYTEVLASSTGLLHRVAFSTHRVGRMIHQGNSIHSRYPIVAANHRLPGRGEPRYVGEARLEVDGAEWTVLVTHLSLRRSARAEQIAAIARLIGPGRRRTLLMGDFNTADRSELVPLLDLGLRRAESGPSYPSWRPSVALDHLFTTVDLTPINTQVAGTVRLSDHLPVVSEVLTAPE